MAGKFADQVRKFNNKVRRRNTAVFRESATRVMVNANTPEASGGKMPVDTGFLRNSVAASTDGMPEADSGPPELVFAKMKIGDKVWVGWTAAYARRMEYGFVGEDSLGRKYNQSGKGFLRTQVQRWSQIVDEVTKEVLEKIP